MTNIKTQAQMPYAFVTKGKQRIKQLNKSVFLNNGEEFEIELFNPTQNKVLAAIEINGKFISDSGIVLRPGERVFLERFLDSKQKFTFMTYNVQGNDDVIKKAIENNGQVSVKFYDEAPYESPNVSHTYWYNGIDTGLSPFYGPVYGADNSTGRPPPDVTMYSSLSMMTDDFGDDTLTNCSKTVSMDMFPQGFDGGLKKRKMKRKLCKNAEKSIETGRVEKGSHSQQSFTTDYTKFNPYYSWETEWHIYPISEKPRTAREINEIWCGACGIKRKKHTHEYCPLCGTKYE